MANTRICNKWKKKRTTHLDKKRLKTKWEGYRAREIERKKENAHCNNANSRNVHAQDYELKSLACKCCVIQVPWIMISSILFEWKIAHFPSIHFAFFPSKHLSLFPSEGWWRRMEWLQHSSSTEYFHLFFLSIPLPLCLFRCAVCVCVCISHPLPVICVGYVYNMYSFLSLVTCYLERYPACDFLFVSK